MADPGRTALLVIDVQKDFLPGGALAVKEGDARVVPVINEVLKAKGALFDFVVASQDWHPKGHASFASTHGEQPFSTKDIDGYEQTLWPDHCVQESEGAELAADLDTSAIDKIVHKGTNPKVDSYSAFFDNLHAVDLGLSSLLKERGIQKVYVVGLATDYCVKFSALDAISEGFEAVVITDATRAVDAQAGDYQTALDEMLNKGVRMVTVEKFLAGIPQTG